MLQDKCCSNSPSLLSKGSLQSAFTCATSTDSSWWLAVNLPESEEETEDLVYRVKCAGLQLLYVSCETLARKWSFIICFILARKEQQWPAAHKNAEESGVSSPKLFL